MQAGAKVIIISILFIGLALLSARFIQPPSAEAMERYKATHSELSAKQSLTPEEQQRLESQFREINSKEKLKEELTQIILRNLIIGTVLFGIAFIAGRYSKLGSNHAFAAGGIIFAAFIIAQVPLFGALSAATFVISALIFGKARPQAAPTE